jgi:hypothetical protein
MRPDAFYRGVPGRLSYIMARRLATMPVTQSEVINENDSAQDFEDKTYQLAD